METLTITLPTTKAGNLAYFTLIFKSSNFLNVIDLVSEIKSIEELQNEETNGLFEIQK